MKPTFNMSFFKKLFGKSETPKHSLETPIEEIKKDREGYVSVGKSIFPIIKPDSDPRIKLSLNTNNPILTEKIADGIVLCFVLDMGENFEMISQKHLNDFGLTHQDIKEVAVRNFINKVNADCNVQLMDFSFQNPMSKPFYSIHMDGNLNPSMMILDEFWETTAKDIVKSDTIAVSIPAKNIIFFSDMKLMESFRTMRPIASQLYDASIQDKIELTKNTYIRKNGKWVLFLDTEEQMAELW